MNMTLNGRSDAVALTVARVLLSIPFIVGGIKNLLAYGAFAGYLASRGIPLPAVLAAPSIATDIVGGLLLVFGVRLRVLAPYLALYTLFTGVIGHPFWLIDDPLLRDDMTFHFMKNVAIAGGLLGMFVNWAPKERGLAQL